MDDQFQRMTEVGQRLNEALAEVRSEHERNFADELMSEHEFDMVFALAVELAFTRGVELGRELLDAAIGFADPEIMDPLLEHLHGAHAA